MTLPPDGFPFAPAYSRTPHLQPLLVLTAHFLHRLSLPIDPAADLGFPVIEQVLVPSEDDLVLQVTGGAIHGVPKRLQVHLRCVEAGDRHVDSIHYVRDGRDEETESDDSVVKEALAALHLIEDVAFRIDCHVLKLLEQHLVLHYVAVQPRQHVFQLWTRKRAPLD